MINNTCNRITFILTFALILTSCQGGGKSKSRITFISGQMLETTTDLDQEERNIATRICYAYQSKANNFHSTEYLRSTFNFLNTNSSCNGYSQYSVKASLVDNDSEGFSFETTNTKKFNKTIQTDSLGYLSKLCTKIKQNEAISNTTKVGDNYIQISFYNDGTDTYIIKYFAKSGTNYIANQSETFKVRTQINYKSGTILGNDEEYIQQGSCNSSKAYSFSQKFVSVVK